MCVSVCVCVCERERERECTDGHSSFFSAVVLRGTVSSEAQESNGHYFPCRVWQVCEGDRVVVWVKNELNDDATTSIHWHGLYQRGTPYRDGTAHITQCPIQPHETFR